MTPRSRQRAIKRVIWGHAESADFDEIAAHDASLLLGQGEVFLGAQDAFEKGVDLVAASSGETERAAGGKALPHLGEGEMFGVLHGDLHSLDNILQETI